ncbi:MAG: carbohydrate ABC transporter permease [Lachnospiraceae bacterium]|jgi:ABC-type glycerol-3-phosphate transport system permease component|nr:carbohydrate ABC transporter permease [Lachnospiraceae bacterium]
MKKWKPSRVLVFLGLCLMSLTFLYPIFYMVITSMKTGAEYLADPFAMPNGFNLENFRAIISRFQIFTYFKNTAIIVVISVALITVLSVMASYAFAKLKFKGSTAVYLLIVSTMFIPAQVTMIPMYVIFAKIGLVDTYTGVILSYLAIACPGAIMLMTAAFKGIDNEVMEAAKIDGAGYFGLIKNVIFPMGSSAIAISVITNFIAYWNDLFTPMILIKSNEKRTSMVALASLMSSKTSIDPTFQMSGLLVSLIPTLIIYLVFQKYLAKGMTAGALK